LNSVLDSEDKQLEKSSTMSIVAKKIYKYKSQKTRKPRVENGAR